jgi:hypothetical protein
VVDRGSARDAHPRAPRPDALDLAAGEWDIALLDCLPPAELTSLAAALGAEQRLLPGRGGLTLLGHALADLVPGSRRGRDERTSGILARSDRIIEDHAGRLRDGSWLQVARLACGLAVGHAHVRDPEPAAIAELVQLASAWRGDSALILAADFDPGATEHPRVPDLQVAAEQGGLRLLQTNELRVGPVRASGSDQQTWLEGFVELTGPEPD